MRLRIKGPKRLWSSAPWAKVTIIMMPWTSLSSKTGIKSLSPHSSFCSPRKILCHSLSPPPPTPPHHHEPLLAWLYPLPCSLWIRNLTWRPATDRAWEKRLHTSREHTLSGNIWETSLWRTVSDANIFRLKHVEPVVLTIFFFCSLGMHDWII